MNFDSYEVDGFHDEMFLADGKPRPGSRQMVQLLESLTDGELFRRQGAAERALLHMGITFNVYGDNAGTERIFPFDIIPRIIEAAEWDVVESGLKQRIEALNLFIDDIYHEQKILKDGVIPEEIIRSAKSYRAACAGFDPPQGIWCHITGTDLVRGGDGQLYVLEDNLRCPSGVSYVLENRQVMKRTFPQVFEASSRVRPVDYYASRLLDTLQHVAPAGVSHPRVAVLTPGVYNSAYFEHSFLAQQMGVELVEGRDLVVSDGFVFMRTTKGFERIDVLYRRLDDDFLDPAVFRKDSLLGVPGLMEVYRKRTHRSGERTRDGNCRRQGRLRLRAQDHQILPAARPHRSERPDVYLRRREGSALRVGALGRTGREGSQRIGRLRDAGGAARQHV